MRAREVMTPKPETLTRDVSGRDALQRMNTLGFRHFPIVESNGRLAGFISERDLLAAGAMVDQPVEALMRDAVVYVDPEATIPAVVDQMVMHRIRAVPVANADGTLHGIISYVDLLQLLQKLLPAE